MRAAARLGISLHQAEKAIKKRIELARAFDLVMLLDVNSVVGTCFKLCLAARPHL